MLCIMGWFHDGWNSCGRIIVAMFPSGSSHPHSPFPFPHHLLSSPSHWSIRIHCLTLSLQRGMFPSSRVAVRGLLYPKLERLSMPSVAESSMLSIWDRSAVSGHSPPACKMYPGAPSCFSLCVSRGHSESTTWHPVEEPRAWQDMLVLRHPAPCLPLRAQRSGWPTGQVLCRRYSRHTQAHS